MNQESTAFNSENADLQRLERRVKREKVARKHAESLLEEKSRKLFESNLNLEKLNNELEVRVSQRTKELEYAKRQAIALAEKDQMNFVVAPLIRF